MPDLRTAAVAAEAIAVVSATALAWRRPAYWPVAGAVGVLVGVGLVRGPLNAVLPPRLAPWEGAQRLLVYADGALVLAADAAVAGLALVVCTTRRRWALAIATVAWALAAVALARAYPSPAVRGEALQALYVRADEACLLVGGLAFAWWARRRRSPELEHGVAIYLLLTDAAILFAPMGPWRADVFAVDFAPVQVIVLLAFVTLTMVQVSRWRSASR